MGLVMESGVIRDRSIMRHDKKDHRNGNAEMRKAKKNEKRRALFWKYACTFLLNSTAGKRLMTKKSITKSYEM